MNNCQKIVHPELSYQIVGVLYKVYNELGGGYQERIYQAAVKRELLRNKMRFAEQAKVNLVYGGDKLTHYFLDFIIEDKIVLELKVAAKFVPRDIMQVLGYLKSTGLELGILASMSRTGLKMRRLLKGRV